MESFKDDLALGFLTLDKILEPNYRAPPSLPTDTGESPLPPVESLNTLVKKKPHYITVLAKEAKLKKKINSNVGE